MSKLNKHSKIFKIFLFVLIFVIFFGDYFTLADFVVLPVSYNVLEDYNYFYNLSINNTEPLKNIIQLNVSFPESFSLISGSFNSSRDAFFVNTSNVFSWLNDSQNSFLVSNQSAEYFWFNATIRNPGFYNVSIAVIYKDNSFEMYNLSFRVNDTTLPYIVIVSPEKGSTFRKNVSIPLNVSFLDNGAISSCWYSIDNSANESFNCGFNITINLSDESFHKIKVYANDSNNNLNYSEVSFFVDSLSPRVSLNLVSSNKTFIFFYADIQDAVNFVNDSVCSVNRGSAIITSNWTRRNITENGLSCGTSYFYNVSCYDYAGNLGSASGTFSTNSCGTSDSSNSASDSTRTSQNSSSSIWRYTFIADLEKLGDKGYNGALGLFERVKLKMAKGEEHYVGLLNLTNESIHVEIASYPQEAELKIGETKKFEVTEDNFYDLNITLNNISNKKANITIIPILEAINYLLEDSNKDSNSSNSSKIFLGEDDDFESSGGKKTFMWIIVCIVIFVIIAITSFLIRKKIMIKKRGH